MNNFGKSKTKDINPIALFLIILISSFLVFLVNGIAYYVLLGMSFVVVLLFSYLEAIKRVSIYLGLYVLIKILSYIDLGLTTGAIIGLIALVLKLYPIFNIGRVLILTSPLKIMAALRKVHFPQMVSIALVTALRYLGELESRIKEIRNGMRVRGLKISPLHPVRSFEFYLIPLIYKCLQVSETLTSSIITRGIEYEGEKTSYNPIYFGILDYIVIFSFLMVFALWRLEG
ncbi:energy-coupling factor transporter transmembrane component T family protein [Anaerococcus prevotii]|uniref:Cobalt transport protein n=2 Tax=Anaerococcus TaxID=165779 RepID=F0GWA1_9FIRM|nr:energy-coupling factor transporter transmembrane component T [Anaerococcus prevotii]EGC81853.1 cobalt transport protein [Anaerococcus prevotii ACS-065-V-Col13]